MPSEQSESESQVFEEQFAGAEAQVPEGDGTEEATESNENQIQEDSIDLLPGRALTTQEAFRITSATQTKLILIAGAVGSGKTTLIASIFHCFQNGSFGDYLFAGSDTLLGFDERCHLARTASGRSTANTERTKAGVDRKFLHLRVRAKDADAPIRNVLIVDLSGEHYRDAKDSVDECRRLPLIRRADHFVQLVDGGKLVQPDQRQSTKNDAIMLLRSCLDAGQLDRKSFVDVLFSKWDLIDTSENKTENMAFVKQVEASMKRHFKSRFGRLRFFRIAARRDKGDLPIGYGVDVPFSSWVEETPEKVLSAPVRLHEPKDISEFDHFLKRKLPELFSEAY